jgi:hypothetical protein
LPTRSENPQSRSDAKPSRYELGEPVEKVLAVVEYEQQALDAERIQQNIFDVLARLLLQAQHARDHGRYAIAVPEPGKLHEPRSIAERGGEPFGRPSGEQLDGEPGLSGTRGPGESNQAPALEQCRKLTKLGLAPHEAGQIQRDRTRVRRPSEHGRRSRFVLLPQDPVMQSTQGRGRFGTELLDQ